MKPIWSNPFVQGAFNKATLRTRRCVLFWGTSAVCIGSLCLAGKSIANPVGEKVRSGSAGFIRQGDSLLIRQDSAKLTVDWKEFSISNGELTRFLQPGSDSAALNRVYGGNPSAIYGSLQANGKVYLINPNGVFIGPSGRVDAGSFIASTLDASDDEFLKGGNLTLAGKSDASVINLGTVTALDGDAFLIAKTVENHGSINAPKGSAGLVGGTEVILQPAGDEKIGVSIGSSAGKVVNTGKIAAAQAELKAAGGNLYALAIQNSGSVRATGVERRAGRVFLRAGSGKIENTGIVKTKNANRSGGRIVVGPANKQNGSTGSKAGIRFVNSGILDASGSSGGIVTISAEDVSLSESSQLLATGTASPGGQVNIDASRGIVETTGSVVNVSGTSGGSIQYTAGEAIDLSGSSFARGSTGPGGNLEAQAPRVATQSAVLDASGATGGRIQITGGDISVDEVTRLVADGEFGGGTIVAIAENGMEFHGTISARAEAEYALGGFAEVSGLTSLTFDGTADLRSSLGNAGTLLLDPTNFTIDTGTAAVITTNLSTSNVVISTGAAGPAAGDIFVNAPVLYSSANSLSLLAHRHIQSNASIQNGGSGALNLVAGWDGVTGLGVAGLSFATFTGAPSSFGNNGGSIFIGNGAQGSAIAVGSRFGATNAAGFGLTLAGSNQTHSRSAQLGFTADAGVAGFVISGPIQVELKGDLTIAGGNSNFSHAQIGHGGPSTNGNFQGSISINTPGDVRITGGVNFSYAQIGHGGDGSSGNQNGPITIRTNDLSVTGGSRPHANSQIGHGDASGDASGSRLGAIDIRASGETSLVNGPGNNAVWFIGHGTNTPSGVSGADVFFSTAALDYSSSVIATQTTLSQDFSNKFSKNLLGGNVTVRGTGSGSLIVDGGFNYNSSNRLTLQADVSAAVNASIANGGAGEIILVIDAANSNRPNFNPAATLTIAPTAGLSSGGPIRLFAVNPGNTNLGGFTPTQRRYNVWFGDALTVAGVNYKFQPTLRLTAGNLTKTYGETVTFGGTEFTFSGLQPGDSLAQILTGNFGLSSSGASATANVVGSPYLITFNSGLTTNFGYGLQLVNGTLAVTPAALTITALDQSKVYGSTFTFAGTEFSSAGLRNNDAVSGVNLTSPGTPATANVASYGISATAATGSGLDNYTISYVPGNFAVTPAALTITALDQSKVYGSTFTFAGTEFSSAGLRNNDAVSGVNLTSPGTPATANVASYGISATAATGSGLDNYTISYVPGNFAVTPAALTITALDQSKVYGSTFTFAGTEFSRGELFNNDAIDRVILASAGAAATAGVAGSPYTITAAGATGSGLGNYTISYVPGNFAVTPAALTITALDQSKVYGSTFTFAGTEFSRGELFNNDAIDRVILASAGAAATAGVAGSPYTITAAGATGSGLGNYTISYVPGNFAVTPAALTITALDQSKVYGSTFTFAGTEFSSAGLRNNDAVSGVNLTSPGTPATANVASYGISATAATGSGLDNYTISYVPGNFAVTPAALTITALDQSKVYGSTFTFAGTEFSSAGLRNNDAVSGVNLTSPGTPATANVASYGISATAATGSGLDNYTISYLPGNFAVTPAALTITALDQSKVYGSTFTFAGTEFSSAGLRNNDAVSGVNLTSPGTPATANVASYGISATAATGSGLDNYTISYLPGNFAVTPAALTITALDQSKVYGSTFTFAGTEFSSAGLRNNDAVSGVNLTSPGTPATANVASYGISATAATGSGLDNYTISYLPGNFAVTPAALTITALDQSKVYGSTFTFAGTEFSSAGLRNNDAVSGVNLTSPGTPATANVASYGISATAATGSGLDNYTISYLPGNFAVTPAALTITALDQSKVYGSTFTFAGTEFSSAGLRNNDAVSGVNLTSPGTPATANVASYGISATAATGSGLDNYTISYLPGNFAVTPAALTITALDQSKVYGNTFTFAGTEFSSAGLRNNDAVSGVNLTSPGTPATANVASYGISATAATGSGLDNYTISYVPGNFAVTPAALTITALDQSKVYGSTFTFAGTEFSSAGLRNNDAVSGVNLTSPGTPATANVASYGISATAATGSGLDNYTISYVPGNFAVTPAALTITALDQSKVYGNTFTFAGTEFSSAGLRNNDAVSSVNLTSPGTPATANVASYGISATAATGSGLDNYTISYVPGNFAVTPAALTITALDQSKVYGSTFTFAGTEFSSAGLRNNDAVSGVNLTSPGTPATANVASYGISATAATGSGLDNYTISYVPGNFAVTPAALTITALDQSKVYGSTFTFAGTEFSSAGLRNNDAVSGVNLTSPGTPATANVASYGISATAATGSGLDNYTISYLPGNFAVTPAALTITALDQSKVYGSTFTFAGTEFSSAGLRNNDAVSSVNLTSPGTPATANVASYGISATAATGSGLDNYTISYVPGNFAVTPAALTITALDQSKVYGSTLSFNGTEFSATGLKNGESVGQVELASAGAAATANVAGGPYAITIANPGGGTFSAGNYAITLTNGTLNVTRAGLTITASNQSKEYGEVFSFGGTEFSSVGLLNGDVINSISLGSAGAAATANVAGGPYAITAANATGSRLGNYTISYVPGALSVTAAPLSLRALDQSKVYGGTLGFNGTEFSATGLKNGESVGQVELASAGAAATAGVAGSPYAITITNPGGGTFTADNYAITFIGGRATVTPATLVIIAKDDRKPAGNTLVFDGTKFSVNGLQNGETIGRVTLSSNGAPASAGAGSYRIDAANARGGTFDPANYSVVYEDGTLVVFAVPPPDPLPPRKTIQQLLSEVDQNLTPQSAGEQGGDEQSIISGFGIQRASLNSLFGEQILESGGALLIDATGLGPPLPIGEAPQNLEDGLTEDEQKALAEAIAEDDMKRKVHGRTRYYEVSPYEVFSADGLGEVGFEELGKGPSILHRATDENIEMLLRRAAEL